MAQYRHNALMPGQQHRRGMWLRFSDLLIVVLAAGLAALTRFGDLGIMQPYGGMIAAMALVLVLLLQMFGAYRMPALADPAEQTGAMLKAIMVTFVLGMMLVLGSQSGHTISRLWSGAWGAYTVVLLVVARMIYFRTTKARDEMGRESKIMLLVKDRASGEDFLGRITDDRLAGVFVTSPEIELEGHKIDGDMTDMMVAARAGLADIVVYCGPYSDRVAEADRFAEMEELPADIFMHAADGLADARVIDFSHIGGTLLPRVVERPFGEAGASVKAVEDKVLGLTCLILAALPMLAIAIAIKLTSKGPVFFKQARLGLNNEPFEMFKFRTMYDAPQPEKTPHATKNDPRVTRVGKFLRASSLDELPQLLNVLKGDMSLIGPRPFAVSINAEYAEVASGFFVRHRVKPGMTGWAQVNGFRGEVTSDEMVVERLRHDLEYIENWSIAFDLRILLMTLFVGFVNPNAY